MSEEFEKWWFSVSDGIDGAHWIKPVARDAWRASRDQALVEAVSAANSMDATHPLTEDIVAAIEALRDK